jgi:hypothetical protein
LSIDPFGFEEAEGVKEKAGREIFQIRMRLVIIVQWLGWLSCKLANKHRSLSCQLQLLKLIHRSS